MRIRTTLTLALATVLSTSVLAAVPASATTYAQIEGAGSVWAKMLIDQWAADLSSDGLQVSYSGTGSAAGRRSFAAGTTDFGVTEIPYQGDGTQGGDDPAPENREFAYGQLASGGLAFSYQLLVDGKRTTDLRLSPETLIKIYTNKITRWDDPAIVADNGGRSLPATPITPVVRTDGSPETYAFTSWLAKESPSAWTACHDGDPAPTPYFPLNCGEEKGSQRGANGNDQAMNEVSSASGDGSIAYVGYAYALRKGYPVASLKNPAGRWVTPNALGVWTALRGASVAADGSLDLTTALGSRAVDAYPIVYVAQALLPTGAQDPRLTTSKRQSLIDFIYHAVCSGQSKANPFGYAPLPVNLVQSSIDQLAAFKTADPAVDLTHRDLKHCDNPTFDAATGEDTPPGTPTVTVERPSITGLAKVGHTLTTSVASQTGTTYTYQWNRSGQAIAGSTRTTYVPQLADIGRRLSVTVTPHRPGYASEPRTSDSTAAVAANPASIKRPTAKVVKAPTRKKSGTLRVSIAPLKGSSAISGPSKVRVTLTLGRRTVTRSATLTFRRGTATLTLPKLTVKGRWRTTVVVSKSHVVKESKSSKPFTVRVTK